MTCEGAGTAKIARIIAESRYRVLMGMDPDTIEGSIDMTPGTSTGELNSAAWAARDAEGQLCAAGGDAGTEPSQARA